MLLGDICSFRNGKALPNVRIGDIPIYGSTGIIGHTDNWLVDDEYILIARVGAQCGKATYAKGKMWVSDNTILCKTHNPRYLTKYIYYLLETTNLNAMRVGSAQPLLNGKILSSVEVKECTLEAQQHIVGTTSSLR